MKKVRFGVIGTNFIVKRFLEAAYMFEEFDFKAIYSRSKETGKEFAQNMESIYVYDDLKEFAGSSEIDAVYIASPTSCHANQSMLLMENKKHILCEKPVCSNLNEWEKMKETASRNHVVVLEAMRSLFTPGYEVIKDNLYKIGRIRKVNFNYCQYSSRYDDFKKGIIKNAFRPELSNGALMDIGVYCVEVMVGLFGRPNNIYAYGQIIPQSIDGMGTIIAEYDDMQANLSYSKITDSVLPCEIQGENGSIYFNNISSPQNIKIRYRDTSEEILKLNLVSNDMIYEIGKFINMVKGTKIQDSYHHISTLSIEILDEARRQIGIVFPADNLTF